MLKADLCNSGWKTRYTHITQCRHKPGSTTVSRAHGCRKLVLPGVVMQEWQPDSTPMQEQRERQQHDQQAEGTRLQSQIKGRE